MNPITDAVKQVVGLLKTNFPTIEVMASEDVKEGINRPSFFIDVSDDIKIETLQQWRKGYEIDVDIVYFSKNKEKNKIENLDMINDLSDLLFSKLGVMTIDDTTSKIVDGVVHYKFKLSFTIDMEDKDTSVLIETLHTTQTLK